MSARIAEIKSFDNPKMLEKYIKKDEWILYKMAEDMMKDDNHLVAITVDNKKSFGVGLYNISTKENIITALPKWVDSDSEDTKEVNRIISDIFHDMSASNDLTLGMYSANEIEEDIKNIIKNSSAVANYGVSVEDEEISTTITDDDNVRFDYDRAFLTIGSLFDEDLIREEVEELCVNDVESVFSNLQEIELDIKKSKELEQNRISELAKENSVFQNIDISENLFKPPTR